MRDSTLFNKHIVKPIRTVPSHACPFLLLLHCLLYILQFKRNRLSKFEYYEGDPDASRASEEVLLQSTTVRPKFYHNGGWLGFKPSDYSRESFPNRWLIAN